MASLSFGVTAVDNGLTIPSSSATTNPAITASGSEKLIGDFPFVATTANQHWVYAFPTVGMVAVFIASDQDLTLKTNSSGSPAQTLAVKAGVQTLWVNTMLTANPITTAITDIYVTPGATAGTLHIWGVVT